MSLGDLLEEDRLGAADVVDRLPRDRLRQEADEIDRVAGAQRHADFALGLHAADSGTVPGARVDDDDGRLRRIDRHVRRRDDAHQEVIDRPLQRPAVEHDLGGEAQHVRRLLGRLRSLDVAPLVERLEKQHAALPGVGPVLRSCAEKIRILRHDRSSRPDSPSRNTALRGSSAGPIPDKAFYRDPNASPLISINLRQQPGPHTGPDGESAPEGRNS